LRPIQLRPFIQEAGLSRINAVGRTLNHAAVREVTVLTEQLRDAVSLAERLQQHLQSVASLRKDLYVKLISTGFARDILKVAAHTMQSYRI
jgi:uncharacterized protein (UPF0335 family)